MLGRLLKYDLRFGARTFTGLFAGLLLLGLAGPWFGETVMSVAGTVMLAAVSVACIILIVQSYYQSLFASQGYTTRVLPVRVSALVGSKLISAMIWFNLELLTFSLYTILLTREFNLTGLFFWWGDFWGILDLVTFNCALLGFVLTAYLAVALGSVSVKGRRLGIIGYIAGAAMPAAMLALVGGQLLPAVFRTRYLLRDAGGVRFATREQARLGVSWDWFFPAACLTVAAACYLGTVWILRKKSDLL